MAERRELDYALTFGDAREHQRLGRLAVGVARALLGGRAGDSTARLMLRAAPARDRREPEPRRRLRRQATLAAKKRSGRMAISFQARTAFYQLP
jgi:hypothetical protein